MTEYENPKPFNTSRQN